MLSWLAFGLIIATSQTNPNPPKPVIIQMSLGFAGPLFTGTASGWPFRPGNWNWLTATVHNPLDRDLDAALTFHSIARQATGRFHVTKEFRLPAQSALRVSFPIRLARPDPPGDRATRAELELKINGEVVDQKRPPIDSIEDNVYALGLLGESQSLDYALSGQLLYPDRGPELQSPGVVRPIVLLDEQIPENPLGLDFLDTLIIIRPSSRELRPGQWAAIDDWVQTGGHIVFVVGSDTAAHEVPDVAALLPAYCAGTRRVTVLPALAAWSGEALVAAGGCTLAELIVRSGRVLLRDGEIPLVIQSQRGAGTVSCVALDVEPGLSDLPAYRRFWLEILRSVHYPKAVDTERLDPFVNSIVERFAGRRVIGIWLPAAIIGGYFVVIGLLIRGARNKTSGESRWLGVCGVAVLFTIACCAIVWATSPTPTRDVYEFWVATGASSSPTVRIVDYLSVLPARRGESVVHMQNQQTQVVPTHERGASVVDSMVQVQGPSVRFQAEKERLRTLHIDGRVAMPGLTARAVAGSDGVAVEFENQSDSDLERTFFKMGRRVMPVGPLARGGRKVIDVKPATGSSSDDRYDSAAILDSAGQLRQAILMSLFVDPLAQSDATVLTKVDHGMAQGTSSQSLYAGWLDRSVLDVSWDDAGTATNSRALGLVAIDPEWQVVGTTFWVPRGGMKFRFTNQGARQYYFGKSVFRGDQPAQSSLRFEFALPEWAIPAKIEQASLSLRFASEAYRLRVFLGDEPVPLPDVPSGRFPLALSNAARPRADVVPIRLVVEPKPEFEDPQALQGHQWSLSELDVECLCRRLPEPND